MKTIGLIGGTGWVSSAEYYRLINEGVNKKLGGLDFAKCILFSLNYGEVARIQQKDNSRILPMLEDVAKKLVECGAEGLALCANTLHMHYNKLSEKIDVPIVHIAEATVKEIKKNHFSKVGLLGTRLTMEGDFYSDVLKKNGIEMLVPEKEDREYINEKITSELFHLQFKDETRRRFLKIMNTLSSKGAQGIILGCTEIPLLIKPKHTQLPLFDTLEIHAGAIVDFMLTTSD
jgi:aspartate racemase